MLQLALLVLMVPAALFASGPIIFDVYAFPGIGMTPGGLAVAECDLTTCDENTTVRVGGVQAPVLNAAPILYGVRLIYFQFPTELSPGLADLVVTSGGLSSGPFSLTLGAVAPSFIDRKMERSLGDGRFLAVSCGRDQTPQPGDLVRTYLYGLGKTNPQIAAGVTSPSDPVARTVLTPSIMVGTRAAEVVESILAPGELAIYRVTFKVPALADGVYQLSTSIGDQQASGQTISGFVQLAVGHTIAGINRAARQSIQSSYACGSTFGATDLSASGDARNPPSILGGTTVKIKDSQGVERVAPMLFAGTTQVNYVIPLETANGTATVTVTAADGTISTANLDIDDVDPAVFRISSTVPAIEIVRVHNGVQTIEQIYKVNASGDFELTPIDLGPEGDQVFLVLFGTGWRFHRGPGLASLGLQFMDLVKGTTVATPDYAGPQGEFAGLDQMNVRLPRSLSGHFTNLFVVVDSHVVGVAIGITFK